MNQIILKDISKEYNYLLFQNVNITFHEREIIGIKGHNGCGKTVLLKIISGLIKPTSGKVIYNNQVLGQEIKIIPHLGAFFSKTDFFENLSGLENLRLLASIRGEIGDKEIIESIKEVGLDPNNKLPVKKYSLGMKQRLGIAQAIMEKIDVLILDEPTNALDNNGKEIIYKIINKKKENNCIIILTSHNDAELDMLCQHIYEFRGEIIEKIK